MFNVGDKVLVLLPTAAFKLQAQWKGPYSITRKVSPANYQVEMTGHRRRRKRFHINMLRKWEQRSALACIAGEPGGT